MKEMIQPYPEKLPDWWVPKLHEGMAPPNADNNEIREWLEAHCREPFYTYPSWTGKKGAQFEEEWEAKSFMVWAALRWA